MTHDYDNDNEEARRQKTEANKKMLPTSQARRQIFAFTACTSFAVKRHLRVRDVLDLGEHFRQMGFTVLPKLQALSGGTRLTPYQVSTTSTAGSAQPCARRPVRLC
jgi:hypothetical protein